MVVRKKASVDHTTCDSMDLSPELIRVRQAITHLPTDEGAKMETTTGSEASTTKKTPRKAPAKKAKGSTKKAAAEAAKANTVSLPEICKPLKLDPRAGRRHLRNAKLKNPGRWSWPKGSAELKKAEATLKAAITDDKK